MFEYFPDNYVWNLSVNIALSSGGLIGEVDQACRPLRDVARRADDAGTEDFFASWCALGDGLIRLAEEDVARGWVLSAAAKYGRAAIYLLTAERMQSRHFAPRRDAYAKTLRSFRSFVELGEENCEFVEIPYGEQSMPGLFVRAPTGDGAPAPCVIQLNGLDSTKEHMYMSRMGHELSRRGIATLMIDTPGSGEALRLRGMTAVPESERWASAAHDYLQSRGDVRPDRVGVLGWSLGGYYAPRPAAFEPRLTLCVTWGANYDWVSGSGAAWPERASDTTISSTARGES